MFILIFCGLAPGYPIYIFHPQYFKIWVSFHFTGSETSPEGLSELSQGPWLLKCNIPIGQSGQLQSLAVLLGFK